MMLIPPNQCYFKDFNIFDTRACSLSQTMIFSKRDGWRFKISPNWTRLIQATDWFYVSLFTFLFSVCSGSRYQLAWPCLTESRSQHHLPQPPSRAAVKCQHTAWSPSIHQSHVGCGSQIHTTHLPPQLPSPLPLQILVHSPSVQDHGHQCTPDDSRECLHHLLAGLGPVSCPQKTR